jgi:subtilisin family serine protease
MESVRAFLQLPDDAPTGKGIRVGVVDTGIDYDHPDLAGVVDRARSTNCMVPRFEDLVLGDGDCMDKDGHGTQVAGAIAGSGAASGGKHRGIAPGASLVALKIADSERGGFAGYVRSAIYAARAHDVQILNFSFVDPGHPKSGRRRIKPPWVWPVNTELSRELRQIANRSGVLCVVAAGNSGGLGEGTMGKHTGAEEVLAVGACECDGSHCAFSSMGPYYTSEEAGLDPLTLRKVNEKNLTIERMKPDFVVPGGTMVVPIPSRHAREARKDPAYFGGRYWTTSGTSIAAAVATGLAACTLEKLEAGPRMPGANVGRLLRRILRAAAAEEPRSDHHRYGAGILLWPAIDQLITRFHTDYQFYSRMLSPDEPQSVV